MLTAATAALVGTIAVARATRLLTFDDYPPAAALRRWWWNQTQGRGGWRARWVLLLTDEEAGPGCAFCAAPYVAAVDVAWALWSGAYTHADLTWSWASAWWVLNVWAAVAYAAAILVARDEPPREYPGP